MVRCPRCETEKPEDEFYWRVRNGKRVLASGYCKQCTKERSTAWAAAHPDRRAQQRAKYRSKYREELREKGLAYYYDRMEREPDVIRAYRLAWQKTAKGALANRLSNHKRRGVRYDKEGKEYAAILIADPCSYCGECGGEVDHITPVARGGDGRWSNLTAACRGCNSKKNDRSLLDALIS